MSRLLQTFYMTLVATMMVGVAEGSIECELPATGLVSSLSAETTSDSPASPRRELLSADSGPSHSMDGASLHDGGANVTFAVFGNSLFMQPPALVGRRAFDPRPVLEIPPVTELLRPPELLNG